MTDAGRRLSQGAAHLAREGMGTDEATAGMAGLCPPSVPVCPHAFRPTGVVDAMG